MSHFHRHTCSGAGCTKVPRIPVAELEWDVCPVGLADGPMWAPVAQTWRASRVSPLANWPGGYAAWMQRAMASLAWALDEEAARRIREEGDG